MIVSEFTAGSFKTMGQYVSDGLGDAAARWFIGIASALVILLFAGAFAFAWSSNADIHEIKSDLGTVKSDVHILKQKVFQEP